MGGDNSAFSASVNRACLMGFLFRLLSFLPLPVLHNLGALAGWLAYWLSPTYRRHLRENIALAGVSERRGAAIAEAGKTVLELPKLWLRPQDEVVGRVVQVAGWDLVEQAWQTGRGTLFLTPHLGCFEIAAQYLTACRPLTALYRRPRQSWLATLIETGRGTRMHLAPADMSGVRKLLKAMKAGGAVLILPDQAPSSGEGEWVPFFGRPAYTMTLASRLAGSGARVLLCYAERLSYGAGYKLVFLAPEGNLTTPAGLNREIEKLILRCPEQYLWGYHRYKIPKGAAGP